MLHGIDIASYQSKLIALNQKWITKYNDFVIIKLTEGTTYKFKDADKFADMCIRSNVPIGLYHYARAEKNDPTSEALHFVEQCSRYGNALLALDVEGDSLKNEDIDYWCKIWLDCVYNLTGKRPLLYASRSELHRFPAVASSDYGLWVADWGTSSVGDISPWKFWAIWQYHVNKELNLDMNMFNGSAEQFKKYCGR